MGHARAPSEVEIYDIMDKRNLTATAFVQDRTPLFVAQQMGINGNDTSPVPKKKVVHVNIFNKLIFLIVIYSLKKMNA